jgi:hypothetical protein
MTSGDMIYITSFMAIHSGIQVLSRSLPKNVGGFNVGISEGRDLRSTGVKMASDGMKYIPSFMKIGIGIQAILGFCLNHSRGCSLGITDGRELWNTPLRWG